MSIRRIENLLMELAWRESEAWRRNLAEILPFIVFEVDSTGRLTYVNSNGIASWGFDAEDMERGVYLLDRIAPESREQVREQMEIVLGGGISYCKKCKLLKKDGSILTVIAYSGPIFYRVGIIGAAGILIDINSDKWYKEEFSKNETRC